MCSDGDKNSKGNIIMNMIVVTLNIRSFEPFIYC